MRRILTGPEQARIDRLEERPPLTAEALGDALPEAVTHATAERRDELAISLEPPLLDALATVARRDSDLFGEILSPTIGAAVRKAVGDAIDAMLERFNVALERSLSVRSLRWRLEAWRTKRPLAEVAFLHTVVFRVQEVFLIHSGTGLVLQHVAAPRTEGTVREDQIAAMLEAIDAFVHEAFQAEAAHLRQIQVGDLVVWIDRDPSITIAAVVRGPASRELTKLLREARERIRLSHEDELARFASDVAPFADTLPLLERCLVARRAPPPRRAHLLLAVSGLILLTLAGVLVAGGLARAAQRARLEHAYVQTLESEPGVVVTSLRRQGGRYHISGLRDPLATSPSRLLARRDLPPALLRFAPFYSLDPRLTERRAAHAAARELESLVVQFGRGSTAPRSRALLARAEALALELTRAAAAATVPLCITVKGHNDATGSAAHNLRLSAERATRVARALIARGVPARLVRAEAGGTLRETAPRRVGFEVAVGGRGSSCGAGP